MPADSDFFAIADASFDSACPISRSNKRKRRLVISDLIVYLRTRSPAHPDPKTDLYRLYCRNAHNRLSQATVELLPPAGVRTKPGSSATSDDFENSAQSI